MLTDFFCAASHKWDDSVLMKLILVCAHGLNFRNNQTENFIHIPRQIVLNVACKVVAKQNVLFAMILSRKVTGK